MDEKGDLKALQILTSPTSLAREAKDIVDEFLFAVSYKEKDSLVPAYMTNTTKKFLHKLAGIKERYLAQLENGRYHPTQNAVNDNDTAGAYSTTEDIAAKLNSILKTLLEKARETPIDVNPNQPHLSVEEALKSNELEIIIEGSLQSDVIKWMAAHPYATAFHIAMILLMLSPGVLVVPLLELVGFGTNGIIFGMPKVYDTMMRFVTLGRSLLINSQVRPLRHTNQSQAQLRRARFSPFSKVQRWEGMVFSRYIKQCGPQLP